MLGGGLALGDKTPAGISSLRPVQFAECRLDLIEIKDCQNQFSEADLLAVGISEQCGFQEIRNQWHTN